VHAEHAERATLEMALLGGKAILITFATIMRRPRSRLYRRRDAPPLCRFGPVLVSMHLS